MESLENGGKNVFHVCLFFLFFYSSQRCIAAVTLTCNPWTNVKPRSGGKKIWVALMNLTGRWRVWSPFFVFPPLHRHFARALQQMDVWGKENIPSGVFLKLLKLRCGSGGDSSIKATPHFPPFLSQDKHNKCYLRAEFFFFYQRSLVALW